MDTDVKAELQVLHDPFSDATRQPKVPDGAVTESLGMSLSSVFEIQPAGISEIILYPGLNTGFVYNNGTDGVNWDGTPGETDFQRGWRAIGFPDAVNVDFSEFVDTATSFPLKVTDNVARWRVVSQGLQMKLLNASDADDGWFEAVRMSGKRNGNDWVLGTIDGKKTDDGLGGLDATNAQFGAMVPSRAFYGNAQVLSNEPTYCTGLLRDLHKVQFELMQKQERMEFEEFEEDYLVGGSTIGTLNSLKDANTQFISSNGNSSSFTTLAEQFTAVEDYDMIYIRIYPNSANTSKLHCHVKANHEMVYETEDRESRYQTKSKSIGAGAMSLHLQARRANGNAATLIG